MVTAVSTPFSRNFFSVFVFFVLLFFFLRSHLKKNSDNDGSKGSITIFFEKL